MSKTKQQAIEKRDAILKKAETRLREALQEITKELSEANKAVFADDAKTTVVRSMEDAARTTRSQVFQLMQDRLSEAAGIASVYRY